MARVAATGLGQIAPPHIRQALAPSGMCPSVLEEGGEVGVGMGVGEVWGVWG